MTFHVSTFLHILTYNREEKGGGPMGFFKGGSDEILWLIIIAVILIFLFNDR